MDRLERLVNLVAALLDAREPLTREQVRDRVGGYAEDTDTFRRNFERDKELLRRMGMPVELEPLDKRRPDGPAGYRIPKDRYQLPDPGLADDELSALHLAASAVDVEGAWGRGAATSALWKLAAASAPDSTPAAPPAGPVTTTAAPPAGQATTTAAPPAGPATTTVSLPAGERVAALFGAVAARQRVKITYRGSVRRVDPWRLSFRNGQWYLVAWDNSREASRTFRVDRLEADVVAVGEPGAFQRPVGGPAAPPPPWQLGDDEEVVASLLVDQDQADWAIGATAPAPVLERLADGGVILGIPVTNRAAFRTFVLGFLDHAQVIAPPALVEDMVGWLSALSRVGAGRGS